MMDGEIAPLVSALVGCAMKISWLASLALMSKATDVAELKLEALATKVYPLPALSMEISLNVILYYSI